MDFLKVENLYKVYGKNENQVVALNGVSLTIEKGEFTAIIGSSGSGKSTLLHAIAGVDVPTKGKIYLNGQDVYDQSNEKLAIFRRRQVGLIYQFHNLIPTLNVVENITLPVLMDRRKVNQKRLNDLLHLLGLEDRQTHLPNQLSGGQQQRVAIARALASGNPVILADEPTGNLDEDMAKEITGIFQEAAKEYDKCVVIVTHSNEVAKQADVVLEMDHGKLNRVEAK